MKTIKTASQLLESGLVDIKQQKVIKKVIEKFSVSVPNQFLEIIQSGNASDSEAIRLQCIPDTQELQIEANELIDPIGDDIHSPIKGLVHRYPDRCLIMPIMSCPVYCRFCFRREKVGFNDKALSKSELKKIYEYIAKHVEIQEVILTGGDPFILKPKKIAEIILALEKIPSVEIIRFHTRVPVVASKLVTTEMIDVLKSSTKAVYVVLHANHSSEFTEISKKACADIINAGIPMLGQTVLLKGINNTVEALGQLMRTFVKNRIKPYYLHHPDLAQGTGYLRVTIKEGQQLVQSLQSRYSGLCLPTYVLDLPGGYGKVPIRHLVALTENLKPDGRERYQIEDYQGTMHFYEG